MNAFTPVGRIIVALLCAVGTSAQSYHWSQLAPVTAPSARARQAMAYDAARQVVVLFGGLSGGSTYLGDVWEWNGISWAQSTSAGGPLPRATQMAYDSVRQRVVLFGGYNGTLGFLGDTWEWDGGTWTAKFSSSYPSARSDHAWAYDAARQRAVLFGGSGAAGYFGDTWEWDGNNWTQVATTISPLARACRAMAYDTARQRIVLFGGYGNGGFLSDTWEWNGSNWIQMTPSASPSPRNAHTLAYDSARQRVVLFGGGNGGSHLDDTWEWNGLNWTLLAPPASPSARQSQMAYDIGRQRMVLFGGHNFVVGFLGDTWAYVLPASATGYGSGCGSPALGFVPDPTARPLLGQISSATVTNAPTLAVGVAMGWNNQFFGPFPLPVSLAGIGMPGCDLLQSSEILGLGANPVSASTLSFSFYIPNLPVLLSSHVYIQAYAYAPGQNPAQVIVSTGIDCLIGDF